MNLDRFAGTADRLVRLAPLAGVLGLMLTCDPGCATFGRDFPSARVADIRNGQTTKSEILGIFGRPYRRGIEDGDSTWTFIQYKVRLMGGQSSTRDLYIRFDGDRVKSYTYNADVP